MDDRHTDGNEGAGVLAALLAVEPTTVRRRCQACADEQPLGAHRAYRGAGIALRCPSCGAVGVVIGIHGDGLTVRWYGVYRIAAEG